MPARGRPATLVAELSQMHRAYNSLLSYACCSALARLLPAYSQRLQFSVELCPGVLTGYYPTSTRPGGCLQFSVELCDATLGQFLGGNNGLQFSVELCWPIMASTWGRAV